MRILVDVRPVDPSIYIEPRSCGCRNPKKHCNRIVFESKKPFAIRSLTADQEGDQGLDSWDLSVFRYPQPAEKLRKTSVNEKVKTLELQFSDEEGKRVASVSH